MKAFKLKKSKPTFDPPSRNPFGVLDTSASATDVNADAVDKDIITPP
jgi:hypothetical protein